MAKRSSCRSGSWQCFGAFRATGGFGSCTGSAESRRAAPWRPVRISWRCRTVGLAGKVWRCFRSSGPKFQNIEVRNSESVRLVEPTLKEGALLFHGQTLAFGFDKKGQPVQIQNGGLAGWRFAGMLKLAAGRKALSHLKSLSHEAVG